jgi:hypothetical protein
MPQFTKTFIVIDGLDECEQNFRKNFINKLRNLNPNLHLLATSRSLPDIEDIFKISPKVNVSATGEDIRAYLDDTIKEAGSLSTILQKKEELRKEIIDTICERAHGM